MNNCSFSQKGFRAEIFKQIFPLLKQSSSKESILDTIASISKSMKIDGKNLDLAEEILLRDLGKKLNITDKSEFRESLTRYKSVKNKSQEDTSSKRLSDEKYSEISDEEDIFESAYGTATYAKMQAKQHANKIGVNSFLYDETGVFNTTNDINNAIQRRQEELLKKVLTYLKSTGVDTSKLPSKMYKNGRYTGVLEKITFEVTPNQLSEWFNNKNKENLEAYSSYVILSNFDYCVKKLFGKAISIDPDAGKYQLDKYSIAGGSNVFNTWRTSEEIDLGKEVNNITQAIVTSIPYISQYNETTQRNLKFSEFCYIISKIKDLSISANNDYKINIIGNRTFSEENLETMELTPIFSRETIELVEGKSFLDLIVGIRNNPQQYIPAIMELMNNEKFIEKLIDEGVINNKFLLQVDKDIINSVYKGLFDRNRQNSLLYIQELNQGYSGVNYFAFIAQTIDSIYKAGFLQYFINPEGQIYVRNMYDQSISNIEYNIKDAINGINSQLMTGNYNERQKRYNIRTTQFSEDVNGDNKLPLEITLNVEDLEIKYNLADGKIQYYDNKGQEISQFSGDKNYEKYSTFIQDILKQNFDLDVQYFEAYKVLSQYGDNYVKPLLDTSVRVLVNQYLSNTTLKDKNKAQTKRTIDKLFPISTALYKPKYNNRLKEISFITDSDSALINTLAQAKALVTGRLTSSQILDSEGNALAASTLSRLVATLPYQIQQQIKNNPLSAANEFSIWKQGVFKGIYQLKELKNNSESTAKSHTEFSAEEMESATVFIDFLQGLLPSKKASTSPLGNGLVCFYPSENSDKTYVGRMVIDLNKIIVTLNDGTQTDLYHLIQSDPSRISEFLPTIRREFQTFYNKALENINQEWKKLGDYVGLQISYNNWSSINVQAALEGKNPLQWVNEKVTEYNNNNPFNPITFIDQVHYVSDKNGNLLPNLSLLENIKRFNDDTEFNTFLYDQSEKTLQSILDDGLNIPSNPDIEKIIGKNWIDIDTNTVILAKAFTDVVRYNSDGDSYIDTIPLGNIRTKKDFEKIKSQYGEDVEFELNPLIDCYNKLNFFFTQEFMNSTVGAYYAHPSKDKTGNPLNDETSRKAAQDKRNVSFTAAMHSYLHNLIDGIPDVINMAIMPDVKDILQTISGDSFDIKNFDGATFENPFFGRMINNSLCGAKVGKNKKTFIHFYDDKTGTGGIVKTADYSLSNYEIRESKFYQVMMQNMTDRAWRNEDGTLIQDLNILQDYNRNLINLGNPNGEKAGQLYYRDRNGRNFAILKIEYLGNNQYSKIVTEVDNNGNSINNIELQELVYTDNDGKQITSLFYKDGKLFRNLYDEKLILSSENLSPITVNTNYKLWKMFGGERALELRTENYSGKERLEWSEHSLDLVANIINKVGIRKSENVKYQSDLWQPLKHSDIHIMPTVGAVKQGVANINEKSAYSTADSSKINFMRIRLDQAGIQLDKEHNADGEELSIMTQVLSACAARGYTQEKCEEMYQALAAIARSGIKEHSEAFEEFFKIDIDPNLQGEEKQRAIEQARNKYQKTIQDVLINALKNSTNDSITLQIITKEILEKARKGKELQLVDICYSDPAMYNKLHSTLAVALTRAAVKIKVDGILSVLCPTYNVRKIYGDKTLSAYNNDSEIIAEQDKQDREGKTLIWEFNQFGTIDKLSNIKLGRHYLITKSDGSHELRHIRTHTEYYAFRNEIQGNGEIINVKEQFAPIPELGFEGGRELASYNATFKNKVNSSNLQSLPTGSDIKAELDGIKDWNKKLQRANELGLNIDISEIYNEGNIYYHLAGLPKITPESFRKETGYSTKDQQRIISMLASKEKGGVSIERAAEIIYENLPEGLQNQYSDMDIRDMIIAMFGNINTPNDIKHYSEQQAIEQAISDYDSQLNEELNQIEEVRSFNIYDLQSVKTLADLKELIKYQKDNGLEVTVSKTDLDNALAQVQEDLTKLNNRQGSLTIINGSKIEIDPSSVEIEPYEIIMPKIFAEIFGLNEYDDLNSIKNDPEFFTKRLIDRIQIARNMPKSSFSVGLIRMNGKHVYVLDSKDAVETDTFKRKQIQQTRENGKLYRTRDGEKLYQMNNGDEVWEQTLGNGTSVEVIVTSDIKSYVDKLNYNTLFISENVYMNDPKRDEMLNYISRSKNKAAKQYIYALEHTGLGDIDNIEAIQYIHLDNDQSINLEYLQKLGKEIHTSFLKSLNVVAARVPAQSMQSFMPMRVVAFEAPDINTAYVGSAQFLFQGSK